MIGDTTADSGSLAAHARATFGAYLRTLRERARMTAPAFARRIGVSRQYYGRVEGDRRAPFTTDKWAALLEIGAEFDTLHALTAAYWNARAGRMSGRPTPKERARVLPGQPRSSTWEKLRWEDDDWCWYAVAHHPEGLSREQVAALTGWTAHRVDQLEQSALAKLRKRRGAREALECLELLHQHRDRMFHIALGA